MGDRRHWTWPWLIAVVSARAVLTMIVGLALWGVLPVALGWKPTTVSTGSMLPRLHVGDVAVSRPLAGRPPTVGSVLLFDDPDQPDRLRLHRFVAVDDDGRLVTRGDANPADDSTPITTDAIVGVGTIRIPWLGLPVVWLREGRWVPLGLTLAGLLGLGAVAAHGRRFGFEPPHGRPPAPRTPPVGARPGPAASPGPAKPVLMVAHAVGLGALLTAVAIPSYAAFSDRTASDASFGALPYFSCGSAIKALAPYVWYRMDETSSTTTTAADSSGNNRTGVYSRLGKTAGATRACPNTRDTGTAMTYNGTLAPYLSSPTVTGAAPNTFTVLIWFRTTTSTGGKLIGYGSVRTGLSPSGYDRHIYMTDAGRINFGVFADNDYALVRSTATYRDNAWHLAVGTLSAEGLKLYVDGALIATAASTTTAEPATGGYWRVAGDNVLTWPDEPTSDYFTGTLDDAAVFPIALTAEQVKGIWTARS